MPDPGPDAVREGHQSLPLPVGLRQSVLAAGVAGQLAAASSGVLSPVVVPFTLGALVGLDQLRTRSPRHQVLLGNVASGAVALAVLVAAPMLIDGGSGLRNVLGPLLLVVQLGQVLLWRTVRDVQTGLLVAFALLLLGASFAPDLVAGVPLGLGGAACVAGLAQLVQHRDAGRASNEPGTGRSWLRTARAQGRPVGRSAGTTPPTVVVPGGPPTRMLVPTGVALVVGLVLFLLVPVPGGAGLASRAGLSDRSSTAAPSARGQGLADQQQLDLTVRGQLGDRPLATVPVDSPQLWRGQVFGTYDGRAWTTTPSGGRDTPPPAPPGPTRTDRVTVLAPTPTLWTPGEPVRVEGAQVGFDDDAGIQPFGATRGYTVTSRVRPPADGAAAGPRDPRWLQLPEGLPQRVRDLGTRLADGAPSTAAAVQAVETFVRENARYDLDSPVPAPGRDAVDQFLFDDKVGFCEQFASAEVVLLRAAGIPARLATGLGYGDDNGPSRTYLERNLHSWVEVSYAGIGWVASDPTPAATQTQDPSLRQRLSGLLQRALNAVTSIPGGRLVLALALAGLLAAGLAGTRVLRPLLARRQDAAPVDRPALAAFLRLDARLGAEGRQPHESLAELRERLDLPVEALAVVEAECYSARPAPGTPAAVAVLDRLAVEPTPGRRPSA